MTATAIDSTRAAELFHALSDPIRVEVIGFLVDGERCVCDLMDDLELQQSRLSWHLKTLVDAGILKKARYQDRPPRYEYRLTAKGVDLRTLSQ